MKINTLKFLSLWSHYDIIIINTVYICVQSYSLTNKPKRNALHRSKTLQFVENSEYAIWMYVIWMIRSIWIIKKILQIVLSISTAIGLSNATVVIVAKFICICQNILWLYIIFLFETAGYVPVMSVGACVRECDYGMRMDSDGKCVRAECTSENCPRSMYLFYIYLFKLFDSFCKITHKTPYLTRLFKLGSLKEVLSMQVTCHMSCCEYVVSRCNYSYIYTVPSFKTNRFRHDFVN